MKIGTEKVGTHVLHSKILSMMMMMMIMIIIIIIILIIIIIISRLYSPFKFRGC